MAIRKWYDGIYPCIFSQTKGVVTLFDKPLVGVEVIRIADVYDGRYVDKTFTDSQGRFSFKEKRIVVFQYLFRMRYVSEQKIIFRFQDEEYIGWQRMVTCGTPHSELNDLEHIEAGNIIKLDLVCELTANADAGRTAGYHVNDQVWGVCRWKYPKKWYQM